MALESKAEILPQVLPTSMELIFIGRTTCDREKSAAVQDRLDGRKQWGPALSGTLNECVETGEFADEGPCSRGIRGRADGPDGGRRDGLGRRRRRHCRAPP